MAADDCTSLEGLLRQATEAANNAANGHVFFFAKEKNLLSLYRSLRVLLEVPRARRPRLWLLSVVTRRSSSTAMILGRNLTTSSGGHVVSSGTWRTSSG